MDAKHTPGPWQLSERMLWAADKHFYRVSSTKFRKDDTSAGLAAVFDPAGCHAGGEQEGQANARVIAAAPELLAALVALVNFQKGREDWPEIRRAEAAIAKATGV